MKGTGTLTLTDNSGNLIIAGQAGDVLVNTGNLIEGSGNFGNGALAVVNAGTIEGTGTGSGLQIDITSLANTGKIFAVGTAGTTVTGAALNNSGTMKVEVGSSLSITGALHNNSDGIILATGGKLSFAGTTVNDGLIDTSAATTLVIDGNIDSSDGGTLLASSATINLDGGTIAGGTLGNAASDIAVNGTETLDGSILAVTTHGTMNLLNQTLSVLGTLANEGKITLGDYAGDPDGTTLVVAGSTLTLDGGGAIVLVDSYGDQIVGASAANILDNAADTIIGSGQLGMGTLSMINGTAGVIDAAAEGGSNGLTIDTSSPLINEGLIEATSANLQIDMAVQNQGGTIAAVGGSVILHGSDIAGGMLTTSQGGTIAAVANSVLDGTADAVTNEGMVLVAGATLSLLGNITNVGTMSLYNALGYPNVSELLIDSPTVILSGAGTITLEDAYNNQIVGASAADLLDNSNDLITGSGQLGMGNLSMINGLAGIIDAASTNGNGSNGLTINTSSPLINLGLIEATTAELTIASVINNVGNKSQAGTISPIGADIILSNGTIEGGLLQNTLGGGTFSVLGTGTLDGSTSTVFNNADFLVGDAQAGGTLSLLGTITNAGTISLFSTAGWDHQAVLALASSQVVLNGGGVISINDSADNFIVTNPGQSQIDTLDNVNNTVIGSGIFQDMVFINEAGGTIDVAPSQPNGSNGLTIDAQAALFNYGALNVGDSTLTILGAFTSEAGAVITVDGGYVTLSNALFEGGTIDVINGDVALTGNVTLNGQPGANGNANPVIVEGGFGFGAGSGYTLSLLGAIDNLGQIYGGAEVIVASPTLTLSGNGTITLADSSTSIVTGTFGSVEQLINVSNTINASGNFGNGELILSNSGTLDASGSSALMVDLAGTSTNSAGGQILATGSGGLIFSAGTLTNSGLIGAENGSAVTISTGASLTNFASSTLTGGTYTAFGGSTITLDTSSTITTDSALIILSSAGAALQTDATGGVITTLGQSLATISGAGTLQISGGLDFIENQSLADQGVLQLYDGTFTSASTLTIASGGSLLGFGTVAAAVALGGY